MLIFAFYTIFLAFAEIAANSSHRNNKSDSSVIDNADQASKHSNTSLNKKSESSFLYQNPLRKNFSHIQTSSLFKDEIFNNKNTDKNQHDKSNLKKDENAKKNKPENYWGNSDRFVYRGSDRKKKLLIIVNKNQIISRKTFLMRSYMKDFKIFLLILKICLTIVILIIARIKILIKNNFIAKIPLKLKKEKNLNKNFCCYFLFKLYHFRVDFTFIIFYF